MNPQIRHDAFLSHNKADLPRVRRLADRLGGYFGSWSAEARVWLDEWEIPVAASRQSAASAPGRQAAREEEDGGALPRRRYAEMIEEGLEHSTFGLRISGFGLAQPSMSANAFGSDWAQLEAGTFRFCDLLNKERRFIPLWARRRPDQRLAGQIPSRHRRTVYARLSFQESEE